MITMSTVRYYTAQAVFDQIATHLLRQQERSATNDTCDYRDGNGNACAVGCLMTDEEYLGTYQAYEGEGVCGLPGDFGDHFDLLGELQTLHDRHTVDEWRVQLKALADRYSLNTDAIQEITA